jgi:hypothetical protein
LIQKSRVKISILSHLFTREKSKGANAVVEIDKDETVIRLLDDFSAVVVGVGVLRIATALDVDPDGKVGVGVCSGWRKNVDEQAIFCMTGVFCLAYSYAYGSKLGRFVRKNILGFEKVRHTLEASWTAFSGVGSCGARNLRLPRGAWANLMPRN